MNSQYPYVFKIALAGDAVVGKTSLISRFVDNIFDDLEPASISTDFKIHTINLDDTTIRLQLWDIQGRERFRALQRGFYRRMDGAIIVYDVTDQDSFDNVREWLHEITTYADKDVNMLIVGNKCDLTTRKVVDYAKAKEYADSLNIPLMEVSAKNSTKVTDAFTYMCFHIKSRMARIELDQSNTPIPNGNTNRLFSWISNMFASCIRKSYEIL